MKLSRRQFLSVTGAVGAGAMTPLLWKGERAQAVQARATHLHPMAMRGAGVMAAATAVSSPPLARFSQSLRGVYPLDPNGIPVAAPDGVRKYNNGDIVANHYTIDIRQYTDQLHPNVGGPTTLWGFHSLKNLGDTATVKVPQRHLGGIIVADRNKPVQITFRNKLPRKHILPVDPTIMGAEGAPNRACVHLHGGEVPWISDGGPFAWFRPNDDPTDTSPLYGASAQSGTVNIYNTLNRNLQPGEAEYYFPLKQSARMMWYHDHAVGITRLNAYAGIATALIVRDDFERRLVKRFGLPDFIENGGRELPLVIQDKVFHDPNIDPDYPGNNTAGSLWYPYKYTDAFALGPNGGDAFDLPISAVPEMFGDTMLVNGLVTPKVTVEPRRYRLRILNATQSRFLNLSMFQTAGAPGDELPDFTKPGPDYLVLGTEGGFLARAVTVPSGRRLNITVDPDTGDRTADPVNLGGSLVTGPAERWDVVVDFSAFAGKSIVLYNDAPGPFPAGGADADGPTTLAPDGSTIVINQMMLRFDVAATTTAKADPPLLITNGFPLAADANANIDPALSGNWARLTTAPRPAPAGARLRKLTLNELFDEHGRLIQMLGTNKLVDLMPGFSQDPGTPGADVNRTLALMYHEVATETPAVGDVEVWEIANLSADVHPIHVHLANAQVLARIPFTGYAFTNGLGTPTGLGPERGPDVTELGWKETIRMNPGEVTRIVMKFSLPRVPFTVPKSPRTGGNEFVWHCHILEHEEHDMMRPLIVRGSNPRA